MITGEGRRHKPFPIQQKEEREDKEMTYGEMRDSKIKAMKSKPNQKDYNVFYNVGGFIDSVKVTAATKADAKRLARVSRIVKVEVA